MARPEPGLARHGVLGRGQVKTAEWEVACRLGGHPWTGFFCAACASPPARVAADPEGQLARGWVLFDPSLMFPGDYTSAFSFFCCWSYECCARGPGRKCVIVDEVWKYCTPTAIPPELALCMQTGRKRGLGTMFATQRPHLVNGALTNELTELVTFRLQEPAALDRIAALGLDAAAVRSLPPGSFLALDTRTGGRLAGQVF